MDIISSSVWRLWWSWPKRLQHTRTGSFFPVWWLWWFFRWKTCLNLAVAFSNCLCLVISSYIFCYFTCSASEVQRNICRSRSVIWESNEIFCESTLPLWARAFAGSSSAILKLVVSLSSFSVEGKGQKALWELGTERVYPHLLFDARGSKVISMDLWQSENIQTGNDVTYASVLLIWAWEGQQCSLLHMLFADLFLASPYHFGGSLTPATLGIRRFAIGRLHFWRGWLWFYFHIRAPSSHIILFLQKRSLGDMNLPITRTLLSGAQLWSELKSTI